MKEILNCKSLIDISKTIAKELFLQVAYPWEVIPKIRDFILSIGSLLSEDKYEKVSESIWISKDAHVCSSAYIEGPAIIQSGSKIRHCAFIRESVIIGKNVVVGNSTELKNSILFDFVQVPHFNYVGDSILGYKSHLGAGAIISNVKSDKSKVSVSFNGEKIDTGLRKFGAILGDHAEIGCNAVLNPGTIIGRNSVVYPTSMVRGVLGENYIFKNPNKIVEKKT